MAQKSLIAEELKKLIGWESKPYTMTVEKGAIRKYADAVGDPNPLYRDEEYARKSKYGAIVGPPTFLCTFKPYYHGQTSPVEELGIQMSHASAADKFEHYLPVKAGDVITSRIKIIDAYEREGSSGKLFFHVHEVTYTNQHGEMVAKSWWTGVYY